MKRIAIVNTRCYRAKRNSYVIEGLKKEVGADVVFTEYAGHAQEIAKCSSGYDNLIATGGDGTISEVVNGMNLNAQVLAIVPFGTANNLARDLGLASPKKAFEAIRKNNKIAIDLIDCRFKTGSRSFGRYIITTSGIGFVSRIVAFANRYLKPAGSLCYLLSACLRLFDQDVISAEIKIDDASPKEIKFTNLMINNTEHAGCVSIFPGADLRDSELNLLYARTNALTQSLWNIGIFTKTYFYDPGKGIAKRLHIILKKPSPFMLDGEICDSVEEIEYSVIPRKLTVLK